MNKRIRKKVAVRNCKDGLRVVTGIFYDGSNPQATREMFDGLGEMYAHRIAHIKLGDDVLFFGKDAARLDKYRRETRQFIRRCERLYEKNRVKQGL